MGLSKQVHLFSVATDAYYNEPEQFRHKRLLKLYKARQQDNIPDWRKRAINRVIKAEKEELSLLLDKHLELHEPRELNQDALCDKNVISLFESTLTRSLGLKTNELTKDLIILNVFFFQVFEDLVKYGFMSDGEKYVFLTASAGQIRTKRAVFIKESAYDKVRLKLMGGLTVEEINAHSGINTNKYLAYLSLNNSATEVWQEFDIDKSIVVDDFETEVMGEVDHIDGETYQIKREYRGTQIPHFDGCGLMLEEKTRMVRMPWMKGLLVTMPFDEFIREKCPNGKAVIKDLYGKEHDILAEGIRYIFTASQFKLWKYYDSWDDYKERFKKYGCEAAYCNIEEDYIPKSRINYQMLQTLSDMTDDEIQKLIKPTCEEIENIGQDFQTTLRLLGATEYNKNPSYFQEALMIYPELFRDPYCRDILKQTKKSLIKQAKGGRLKVDGKYYFLAPDTYAFCEWLFLGIEIPKGLLADGEVYNREFRDGDELACLRSPHLYREWPVKINKRNEETDKWFGCTKCIYTSSHDLITRYVMADVDGDHLLVIRDKLLTKIAKRNMEGIVPLAYDLKKAQPEILSSDSMYQGMSHAYTGGNIGPISNNITKVWNSGEIGEEQLNVVKWLCFQNNAVIDYAKTLWLPTPPAEVEKTIRSYTKAKVPDFFMYAKDKEKSQVELPNTSTMNKIAQAIPEGKLKFTKTVSKFDYRMLMNLDVDFSVSSDSSVVKAYDYWSRKQFAFNEEANGNRKDQELYRYQQTRLKIIEDSEKDIDYIVNTLVAVLYTARYSSQKKTLWACFGDVIVKNLKKNLEGKGKICPICGKRFMPKRIDQIGCSNECAAKINVLKQRKRDANLEVQTLLKPL